MGAQRERRESVRTVEFELTAATRAQSLWEHRARDDRRDGPWGGHYQSMLRPMCSLELVSRLA